MNGRFDEVDLIAGMTGLAMLVFFELENELLTLAIYVLIGYFMFTIYKCLKISSDKFRFLFGFDIYVHTVDCIRHCDEDLYFVLSTALAIQDHSSVATIATDKKHLPQATKPYFSNDFEFRTVWKYWNVLKAQHFKINRKDISVNTYLHTLKMLCVQCPVCIRLNFEFTILKRFKLNEILNVGVDGVDDNVSIHFTEHSWNSPQTYHHWLIQIGCKHMINSCLFCLLQN